ncbi:hypothetical protein HUK81_10535 [Komagataeibacter swingsii]|uniref:Uncharacterized protein n=1 Tax=Komagataeibacter swingsii TaxID=215220 RepID=A0A850P8X9_9PROT|nr:hypothetical protein [Komagataeibacter swingsii]
MLACLVSYPVAWYVMMDIAHVAGSATPIQLGQIVALACLPVLVVLCFSAYAGLLGVCVAGCIAALAGLLAS